MMQHRISREIAGVAARCRELWLHRALSICWTVVSGLGAAMYLLHSARGWPSAWAVPLVAGIGIAATLVLFALSSRIARSAHSVAQRIESRYPDLDSRLLAALELKPDLPDGRFGYLRSSLISEVLAHARRAPWSRVVPQRQLRRARLLSLGSLGLLAAVNAGLLAGWERGGGGSLADRVAPAGGSGEIGAAFFDVAVEPGDAEVEKGSSLLILARFAGELPGEAALVLRSDAGGERRVEMAKSLDDPLFAARLGAVTEDLSYRVEFAGGSSPSYRITVFEYPELVRADARLEYPAYTRMEPRTVQDTRAVSAVVGTHLTWILHLNKSVVLAELVDEEGESTGLSGGGETTERTARMRLERSHRYRVRLVDDRGRESHRSREIAVRVLPNSAPELKVVSPSRDVNVSPLEELTVKASAWDDFGLRRLGLSYTVAGEAPRDVILGEDVPAQERRAAEHLIDFEALEAEPDQLLSYAFWAEDTGPDERPRRTFSDMFFAEVRPFEEIFRQGEQPPGGAAQQQRDREPSPQEGQQGEGQNARRAEQLAELQKQIISGTWRLIRRSAGDVAASDAPADARADAPAAAGIAEEDLVRDAGLLRDSQQSALEQAAGLADRIEDVESLQHVALARQHMGEALENL
ncbi:MAG: hypothetical protein JXA90_06110, partial [Planctomycetes bacterium]|nr:hypothetical protein [Planctomycetota bacterium]